jgi:hypothetical protein
MTVGKTYDVNTVASKAPNGDTQPISSEASSDLDARNIASAKRHLAVIKENEDID